jgi:uncharacterized protein (DUF2384 family)
LDEARKLAMEIWGGDRKRVEFFMTRPHVKLYGQTPDKAMRVGKTERVMNLLREMQPVGASK